MRPMIKWTGGKRRELKHLIQMLPENIERFVEPFVGGGALYFHLEHKNSIINDWDYDLINFYKNATNSKFLKSISELELLNENHDAMSEKYYELRALDRGGLHNHSNMTRAIRFFYVNQLAFSGMRRFNKSGEFNVPFGHYKRLSNQITNKHLELLKTTDIKNEHAVNIIINEDNEGTFIFLDPPYTKVFKTYSPGNEFTMGEQRKLCDSLKALHKAKFMLVINKEPEILKMYNGFNVAEYDVKYGVNIRNRFNTDSTHVVITNY